MSKQTAVEWLENQLKDVKYNRLEKNGYTNAVNNLYAQAKQMEKEQIIWSIQEAYGHGRDDDKENIEESINAILKSFNL
jgi:hypothetical protein